MEEDSIAINDGKKPLVEPGALVRPCNNVELMMAKCGSYKNQTSVQAIWLSAKRPIPSLNVKRALAILARKIPLLRFRLVKSEGRLWFGLMKNFTLDFKTSEEEVMDVYHELLNSSFNLWKGPLWRVRLVQRENETVLIFCLQHSITDGITNVRLCREAVQLINQLNTSATVEASLSEPLPLSPYIHDTYKHLTNSQFLVNYYCLKIVGAITSIFKTGCELRGNILSKDIKQAKTKTLVHEFTEQETQSLLVKCKKANVTINSFMTSVMNMALLSQTRSKSISKEVEREIRTTHCVNLRRHMKPEFKETLGCFISWIEDCGRMSEQEDVWESTKLLNERLKKSLEDDLIHLKVIPIVHHICIWMPMNYHLSSLGLRNKVDVDYVSSNLGNVDNLLQPPLSNIDDVEITQMIRSSSFQFGWTPFVFAYHTFRGRLNVSFDYFTNKVTEKDINDLFKRLCDNTSSISRQEN